MKGSDDKRSGITRAIDLALKEDFKEDFNIFWQLSIPDQLVSLLEISCDISSIY